MLLATHPVIQLAAMATSGVAAATIEPLFDPSVTDSAVSL
jgi:hypothetical protein